MVLFIAVANNGGFGFSACSNCSFSREFDEFHTAIAHIPSFLAEELMKQFHLM